MKFGKEFQSQMVPEWQQAYMDYGSLKTLLKDIQRFKQRNRPTQPTAATLTRKYTLRRAFSGLTRWSNSSTTTTSAASTSDLENQVILVNSVRRNGEEGCETMFLMAADDGGELELVYFRRLDFELNKVVKFYKSKVEEVMKEAAELNKQMDALIAFRIKVDDDPRVWFDSAGGGEREMTRLASGVAAATAALSASTPRGAKLKRRMQMEIIEEDGPSSEVQSDESSGCEDFKETKPINQNVQKQKPSNIMVTRPQPLEILNHVKMTNTLETPRSTIKGFLNVSNQTELKFNKENLKKIEERLKLAFIQFHHKLRFLKSYSFLNLLAFSKIMKKYDKIASRNASKPYLKMVDDTHLGSSDEVTKLIERVEATFIKHFSNSNRRKGMNILRPKAKKERHRVTFSLGFFAGCSLALLLALILVARARDILGSEGRLHYMDTMFPLYSLFGFIVLHMIMYAANVYFWRRYRVNFPFIFGFKEGTELGYREVLLVSFGLAILTLACVLSNLDMEMDPKTMDYKVITELLPLGLVGLLLAIMLCPLNIIYRSSRFFFLTCLFHCICAPLYKVTLPDFFLADQLTSQVPALRSLQFYICYYGWGDYKRRENNCNSSDVYNVFFFIVAVIPYWMRLLQVNLLHDTIQLFGCLRRLYEERDPMQGYNGLKYFSTIVAVCTRTAYSVNKGISWRVIAWIASVIATIFATYWDILIDWGLFNRNSKNRWLRDKLLIPHKTVYFVAMVLNVLLRLAWLQSLLGFGVSFLHGNTLIAIVATLEIIRRGIWNFFRLENEHLNNVGKYRAFKSVPLPFNYDEDEEKDE
ncbi:unnamed protein product [Ilex paraguariensis]|uniref:Uncharacterized protein n=1 Tax=Ilex paraguariensis TaxID=185542 RepID=A0ABC8UYL3_9AQUA